MRYKIQLFWDVRCYDPFVENLLILDAPLRCACFLVRGGVWRLHELLHAMVNRSTNATIWPGFCKSRRAQDAGGSLCIGPARAQPGPPNSTSGKGIASSMMSRRKLMTRWDTSMNCGVGQKPESAAREQPEHGVRSYEGGFASRTAGPVQRAGQWPHTDTSKQNTT